MKSCSSLFIIAAFIITAFPSIAQNLSYDSGLFRTKYFEGKKEIEADTFVSRLKTDPAAYAMYRHYKTQGTIAVAAYSTGAALGIISVLSDDPENVLIIGGTGLTFMVTGIILAFGADKKLKKSVNTYNTNRSGQGSLHWQGHRIVYRF